MWKASRWAVFSPMPGSFASSFTRRAMGSATAMLARDARDLDPAGRLLHVLVGGGAGLLGAGVDRGGDEVLEHGEVADGLGVDRQLGDLALPVHPDLDQAPAALGLDGDLAELLLGVGHRLLELLGLL